MSRDLKERGIEILKRLNSGSLNPKAVPEDIIRNLRSEMISTGASPEELVKLLSIKWRDAWYALDKSWAGFREDVQAVRENLHKLDARLVEEGSSADYLGYEIFCALISSSMVSYYNKFDNDLIEAGLMVGLMSEEEAVEAISKADFRTIKGVLLLLSQVNQERLIKLAKQRPLEHVTSCTLAEYLDLFGEYLKQNEISAFVKVSRELEWGNENVRSLALLLKYLDEPLKTEVLDEVLEGCKDIEEPISRCKSYCDVAMYLTGTRRREVIDTAIDIARSYKNDLYHSLGLASVLPLVDEDERAMLIEEALQIERTITHESIAYWSLKELLEYLSVDKVREALAIARGRTDPFYHSQIPDILMEIAKLLPETEGWELILEVLDGYRSKKYGEYEFPRSEIFPYLTQDELIKLLKGPEGTIHCCLDGQGGEYLPGGFKYIVANLEEPQKTRVVKDAFQKVTSVPDKDSRAQLFTAIGEMQKKLGKQDSAIFKEAMNLAEQGEYSFHSEPLRLKIASYLGKDEEYIEVRKQRDEILNHSYIGSLDKIVLIAKSLPTDECSDFISKIFSKVMERKSHHSLADIIRVCGEFLPEDILQESVSKLMDIYNSDEYIADVKKGTADRTHPDDYENTLNAGINHARGAILSAIGEAAKFLPETGRPAIVQYLREHFEDIEVVSSRIRLIVVIAPLLDRETIERLALKALNGPGQYQFFMDEDELFPDFVKLLPKSERDIFIDDVKRSLHDRTNPIIEEFGIGVVPFQDYDGKVETIMELIDKETQWDAYNRSETLTRIREMFGELKKSDQFTLVGKVLENDCKSWRRNLLTDLSVFLPVLVDLGGNKILDDLLKQTHEIVKWWG